MGTFECVLFNDCELDGVLDHQDPSSSEWRLDFDGDGKRNFLDSDSDNDWELDGGESWGGTRWSDIDGDDLINMLDSDADGDYMPDGYETRLAIHPGAPDTDADGVLDGQDINPKSGVGLFNLNLDTAIFLDPCDIGFAPGSWNKDCELYLKEAYVTIDSAGENRIATFDARSLGGIPYSVFNSPVQAVGGKITDFMASTAQLEVPQKIELSSVDVSERDIKLYLWLSLWDHDPGDHDWLDAYNGNEPAPGRDYRHLLSLTYDGVYQTVMLNGGPDSRSDNYFGPLENDIRISGQGSDSTPATTIINLVSGSCYVRSGDPAVKDLCRGAPPT